MPISKSRQPAVLALMLALVLGSVGHAPKVAAASIDAFVGVYHGSAEQIQGDDVQPRDLAVTIGAEKSNGFSVEWTSVTYKADGRKKRKTHRIVFRNTKRSGVYRSAMRENMFGQQVPNDPIDGEPYVWATLNRDTLVVHALHVLEDGHYELQTYERTLMPNGLALDFHRLRDGVVQKAVTAKLQRVSK